jgi:AcrR family transcriptional regulator
MPEKAKSGERSAKNQEAKPVGRGMLLQVEELFAATGRTPKGRRALAAIFRAGMAAVAESGVHAASMERIGADAGLTQAAVRHYFPTRDELLTALFTTAATWFRSKVSLIMAERDIPAAMRLMTCIDLHLQYMELVDSVFWLEASAYWIRTAHVRRFRNEFYQGVIAEYAILIGEIRPDLKKRVREERAFAAVTLSLGAWITHGRGSSWGNGFKAQQRRELLLQTALQIAAG